ncbi:MAG: fibronectin type III domain-containing protein, partial [Patescibacteria group bacterium]|nr:fibronectin type III domain-containing protein [Patescibacteria group bacterium]
MTFNKNIFVFLIILCAFFNFSYAQTTPPSPGQVSNLVISDITTSSLKLSWHPSTNTDYYKIQRDYTPNIASTTETSFIDTGLFPCTKYMYVIESVNRYYGNENRYVSRGTYSGTASATTQCLDYYDFHLGFDGPQTVVQGNNLYLRVVVHIFYPSNPNNIYFRVVNQLPSGVSVSFPDISSGPNDRFCNNPDLGCQWWRPSGKAVTTIKITTSSSTPLGIFTVRVQAKARHFTAVPPDIAVRYVDIPINVLPQPQPLPKKEFKQLPPLPEKSRWESNMVNFGSLHCEDKNLYRWHCCGWEGGVWYYDGMRVYYNITDYTQDPKWITCASYFKYIPNASYTPYRQVVLEKNGRIHGWRVFTEGLTRDYFRFGDILSRQAVILLSQNSGYANVFRGQRIWDIISPLRQREVAYAIMAHLDAEKLGMPEHPELREYVNVALGHLDQLFNFTSPPYNYQYPYPYTQPFYVALASEALIRYYEEKEQDPRIPVAIKQAYEWIWEYMRGNVRTGMTISYSDKKDPHEGGGPNLSDGLVDLNLLNLPPLGWLYTLTGDEKYIEWSDLLWSAGVKGAWLSNGKQFSQNYRWSFKYLEWRDGIKLNPYVPPSANFLNPTNYHQYLKISLFSDNYSPQPGDIITYRAVLRNISTTTLVRTRFSFPLTTLINQN